MAKRQIIDFQFQDIEFDIICIHCILDAARLAWQIDLQQNTAFTICNTPFITNLNGKESRHRRFFFEDAEKGIEWWLIENKGSSGYLWPTKPNPEMLIILRGEENDELLAEWTAQLKLMKGIQMAYVLPAELKKKATWIPDLMPEDPKAINKDEINDDYNAE